MDKAVEPFSAGYFMLNADTVEHSRDAVVMPRDLFGELANYVTYPLIRTGNSHFWGSPEHGIPANTVVVPEGAAPNDDQPVLMAKDETAERLVITGEQPRPA